MTKNINYEILNKRWVTVDGKKILKQLPNVLQNWQREKDNRDFENTLISVRFYDRLEIIKKHLTTTYPNYKFKCVTNKNAYIDEFTEIEEPELWEAKKTKKTWSGIYPKKFKLSDIDLNVFDSYHNPIENTLIVDLIKNDKYRIPKCSNLLLLHDIKVDLYQCKNEEGFFIN